MRTCGERVGRRAKRFCPVFRDWIGLPALALAAACGETEGDGAPAPRDSAGPTWTSESQYKIGDLVEGDAIFDMVRTVRVSRNGERVFIAEPGLSRVSVWTPDGRLLLEVGRPGGGPGDLATPTHVYLHDSGFMVRERRRFSYFSADGEFERTANFPGNVSYQGFQIHFEVPLADGSFLGWPSIPLEVDDPIETLPLLLVSDAGTGWSHRTLVWRNYRNETLAYIGPDGHYLAIQPFSDADEHWADPVLGTVLLARNVGGDLRAGEAEIIEIAETGDTIWQRRLRFNPLALAGLQLDEALEGQLNLVGQIEEAVPGIFGRRSPRDVVEEGLYLPEHLPAVKDLFLASFSGEVWIQSHERLDTLSVWYAIPRGEDETPPRRVLLPVSFHARDATEAHVWGEWRDELDVSYVVGRRLVSGGSRP